MEISNLPKPKNVFNIEIPDLEDDNDFNSSTLVDAEDEQKFRIQ